jgi:hypothetical protein
MSEQQPSGTEAPYEKAIEETAKAAGKALDIVKGTSGAVADVYGFIIGDHLGAARARRLDKLARRTKKIIEERNLSETAEVAEQIAMPLLEAAQRESREELQELWAQLLANAQDPSRAGDVRPEIISALGMLQPIDVRVLRHFGQTKERFSSPARLAATLKDARETAVSVSFDNLVRVGCIRVASNSVDQFGLTPLGIELIGACEG